MAMKQLGIKGVYYSTAEGDIIYRKICDMQDCRSTPYQLRKWGNGKKQWKL